MRSLRVGRIFVESVEDLLFALRDSVAVEYAHRRHAHRFRRCRRSVEQRRFQVARRRRHGAADRRHAHAAEISQRSSRVGSVERRTARDGGGTVHAGGGIGVSTAAAAAATSFGAGRRVEEVDGVGGGKETGCDAGGGRGCDGDAFDSHHVDRQRVEVNLLAKKFVRSLKKILSNLVN